MAQTRGGDRLEAVRNAAIGAAMSGEPFEEAVTRYEHLVHEGILGLDIVEAARQAYEDVERARGRARVIASARRWMVVEAPSR